MMSSSKPRFVNLESGLNKINRRDALVTTGSSIFGMAGLPTISNAEDSLRVGAEVVDLTAIKEAQSKGPSVEGISSKKSGGGGGGPMSKSIFSNKDPNPYLTIRGSGIKGKSTSKIQRVGYSLYKTAPDVAARCTALALRAGIKHFDVGTLYGSNTEIASPLKRYLDIGLEGVDYSNEKPELLSFLDDTRANGEKHALETVSAGLISTVVPAPSGSIGRRRRREGLFIAHKLSNAEQSTKRVDVQRAVKAQISILGTQYLDMVSIHSPLTDRTRRLESYAALLELRDAGLVKNVGVVNYGIGALTELKDYGLDLPSMNQLELSPFNTHADIVQWCDSNNVAVGCGAWSKLSSASGPQDQWAVIAEIGKKKGMTKAQVLVRWSLQKGYVCVPRSAATSKVERIAIGENSYGGVNRNDGSCVLTEEEMNIIDSLNVDLKCGKLGRRDGWRDEDVIGDDWEPTNFV